MSKSDFEAVQDIMKFHYMWFDYPKTFSGKMIKLYSDFRLFLGFVMALVASSQIYFYGMSYIVHDSVVLVPLGMLSLPVSLLTRLNFKAIMSTISEFHGLVDSFPKRERDIINKEMMDNRRKSNLIVKSLDYYVFSTALVHVATISSHYFFEIPKKPVVLPLLYEKFLEGNLELRPMLIIVVIVSLVYINILLNFSAYVAVLFYVMKASVGMMKALSHRLELMTEQAGNGCERLTNSLELGDTIDKHGSLLEFVSNMMSWNALPMAYTTSFCTLLFCLNAITLKQSINKSEFSSAVMWGTFLLVSSCIIFVICSNGQEVELESESLLLAIYRMPWYRESPKARRDVVLMIAQGNRLIKLNYKGFADINMVKFSEVVQTAYSYFMILSTVE